MVVEGLLHLDVLVIDQKPSAAELGRHFDFERTVTSDEVMK